MSGNFEISNLLIRDLEKYYDKENKELRPEGKTEILIDVTRMVRYDVTFEKKLLDKTLSYIKSNYNGLELWETHDGNSFPVISTVTETEFDEEMFRLRKNFSHERVAWLKQAGQKLYGSKTATTTTTTKPKVEVKPQAGELQAGRQQTRDRQTHSQQTNNRQTYNKQTHNRQTTRTSQTSKQSSSKGLMIAAAAIVIIIAVIMWILD